MIRAGRRFVEKTARGVKKVLYPAHGSVPNTLGNTPCQT